MKIDLDELERLAKNATLAGAVLSSPLTTLELVAELRAARKFIDSARCPHSNLCLGAKQDLAAYDEAIKERP